MKTVAVIGCGYWGKNLVRNFYELNALYAICDQDKNRLEEFSKQYPGLKTYLSYKELLNNTDVDKI